MTSKTEEEIFVEKKNGKGKGGVYLEKEYIFLAVQDSSIGDFVTQ